MSYHVNGSCTCSDSYQKKKETRRTRARPVARKAKKGQEHERARELCRARGLAGLALPPLGVVPPNRPCKAPHHAGSSRRPEHRRAKRVRESRTWQKAGTRGSLRGLRRGNDVRPRRACKPPARPRPEQWKALRPRCAHTATGWQTRLCRRCAVGARAPSPSRLCKPASRLVGQ